MRTVARYGERPVRPCRYLLDGLDVPLTEPVTLADSIGPATLRSLDAIHLAAAARFRQGGTAFVT